MMMSLSFQVKLRGISGNLRLSGVFSLAREASSCSDVGIQDGNRPHHYL